MSADPLIVPTIVPGGSLHFATIVADGTVQDVLDTLIANAEVTAEVLGDLEPYGWAMQRIRREHNGRQWEEDELEALGNGILPSSTAVAPLLNAPSPTARSQRHFSAFPLTSHLHTPTLRLVSLHPFLSATFSFLRVPEIHDGFQWKLFISRSSTVRSAVDAVIEELGLTKALPVPGGGSLEYVLEEVWSSDHSEKATRMPFDVNLSEILENPLSTNPYGASASRSFRFCVPDEWYRRSKSRSTSSTSTVVSEDTIRRLADLQEDDEDEEEEGGEGTAKQKSSDSPERQSSSPPTRGGFVAPVDWRGSISQNRFSSILDSWMRPQSPVGHEEKPVPKVVSEPKLVEHKTGDNAASNSVEEPAVEGIDPAEFEQMLDDLGLKGPKREAMYRLPGEQKRYLLQQNQVSRASTLSRSSGTKVNRSPATPSTYGPASAAAMLPRLVPQLTGDSIMKRFSIAGWSAGTSSPSSGPPDSPRSSVDLGSRRRDSMVSVKSPTEKAADTPALQPQSTGGLWSSWWMSSGGDKGAGGDKSKEAEKTAAWYAAGIRNGRSTDTKLVKHLISLRVHLSTANLAWIEEFVTTESGMNVLSDLLARLVSKGGKRKKITEIEDTVLLETIKCLRALLNTEPGFREVLAHPTIIPHLAYSLHGSSAKLRTLTSEVLAAICVLSLKEGHKAVLSAMSDYRVEFEEAFRFQELIASMRLPEMTDEEETASDAGYDNEEGAWEARTASMALINALTNCPDSLEERILLREEFSRRGLNEVIVTLRYIKPPESLVTQLDVYTEEKFEDEEDMRERARDVMDNRKSRSDSEPVVDDLLRGARQHEELYPTLLSILRRFADLFDREIDPGLKAELFTVLEAFVQQSALLDDLRVSILHHSSDFQFAESVQHVTGQVVDVRLASDADHSLLQDEIEHLRTTVDQLTEERSQLRNELEQQSAELSTLKSIPPIPASIGRGAGRGNSESTQNFHGLVQRLVQKEKQVLQLQAELDRLKAQNPAEPREVDDRAKRERDRVKWHALNEEIANLKSQTGELESSIAMKDKEIIYLKRALESVYSRFRSREESRESETREAEFDAQAMASRAIDSLTRKDEEIAALRAEIEDLKIQLAAKPKFITEKDYKHQVAPPPPPSCEACPRHHDAIAPSTCSPPATMSSSTVSLYLDPQIRDWVLFPITVVMILVGILRHYVVLLLQSPPKKLPRKAIREQSSARPLQTLHYRRHTTRPSPQYLSQAFADGTYLKDGPPKADAPASAPPNPLTDPSAMEGMMAGMKTQMVMMVPQMIIMGWINFFFQGFVLSEPPSPRRSRAPDRARRSLR
ncbi:hypothetical protein NUW54_g4848 [Trametes sanguinea]|uniref:Uncharacterized protein n=1 Tax=Trametes sanguinea TaxID=158606 RepID=A0ACC1PWW5_9APHY|nr:hypothetical protein NUW54_g4848 [Trametes sanguinea]